ncbi:MAG: ribbon-helix-helix protein, CopG family [Candidatus Baldrarchaeia archaeon]|nr:ribbon-helix-helix protein, CopG family [Candidatus Baldrarchaeota archaeon]
MVSRKVSISLPERLLKIIDRNAKSVGLSRSEYIARILEEKLGTAEEPKMYPTVLWKLRTSVFLKMRSPRYPSRRIKGRWIVEKVNKK